MRLKFIKLINRLQCTFLERNDKSQLKIPYQNAEPGDCGIACVAMILLWKHVNFGSFASFIKKYKTQSNYIEPIGWRHHSLLAIINGYSIRAEYHSYKTIFFLRNKIRRRSSVIVSVKVAQYTDISQKQLYMPVNSNNKALAGHLIVITGYCNEGFIVNDPRNVGVYTKGLIVPYFTFANIFSGNCIVIY